MALWTPRGHHDDALSCRTTLGALAADFKLGADSWRGASTRGGCVLLSFVWGSQLWVPSRRAYDTRPKRMMCGGSGACRGPGGSVGKTGSFFTGAVGAREPLARELGVVGSANVHAATVTLDRATPVANRSPPPVRPHFGGGFDGGARSRPSRRTVPQTLHTLARIGHLPTPRLLRRDTLGRIGHLSTPRLLRRGQAAAFSTEPWTVLGGASAMNEFVVWCVRFFRPPTLERRRTV